MVTVVNVTDNSFDPEVLKCDIPVLANFGAKWSVPGQKLEAALKEIAVEHSEQVKVVNVDIKLNPEITAHYSVLTIPALILFKNGQEVARLGGSSQTKQSVMEAIRPYFDQ